MKKIETKRIMLISLVISAVVAVVGGSWVICGLEFSESLEFFIPTGLEIKFPISWWWNVLLIFSVSFLILILFNKKIKKIEEEEREGAEKAKREKNRARLSAAPFHEYLVETEICIAFLLLFFSAGAATAGGAAAPLIMIIMTGVITGAVEDGEWLASITVAMFLALYGLFYNPIYGALLIVAAMAAYSIGLFLKLAYKEIRPIWNKI